MSDLPIYVLERVFDAPRELVWKAWTDPTLLPRWYGPNVETGLRELSGRATSCGRARRGTCLWHMLELTHV